MNSNDSNLLDEVKDTLNAITALKNGKPTVTPEVKVEEESTEEVVKDEAVEETKDAAEEVKTETTDEVVKEVTEEKTEETEEESEEVEESTKEEETEAETEKTVKEETVTKFANASDVSEILNAVKELTSYVSTLSGDVEALKNAKTSRKGIMPETEVEEVQEDKNAKLIKQADYIFGK